MILTEREVDPVTSCMHVKTFAAGQYLFLEGDEADRLIYILAGKVKLIKTMEDGKQIIVSILQAGDIAGETIAVGGKRYEYDAVVIDDAEIGMVRQEELEELLKKDNSIVMQLLKWVGLRKQITEYRIRDLLLYGKPGALASILIRLCNTFGTPVADGIRIDLKLNHTELAELIGATRESVNRMLGALKEEGTISICKGVITVHDLVRLRTTCRCPVDPVCPKEICRL